MAVSLMQEGYCVERAGSDVLGIPIICPLPLCGARCADHAAFARHLPDYHILKQTAMPPSTTIDGRVPFVPIRGERRRES